MGIRHPIVTEIAQDTFLINEFGIGDMYVLNGSKSSLLIDCGSGYFDLKALTDELTKGRPYEVAITHGHFDHVGMMHQFDKVYINAADIPSVEVGGRNFPDAFQQYDGTWVYPFDATEFHCNNNIQKGDFSAWEVTEDMVNRGNKATEIVALEDGHVFDLGDRKVTAYELPGHTAGCMYLIDDKSRIAFTGDCCHPDLRTGLFCSVSTTLKGLIRLYEKYGVEYDRMFSGHVTYCGDFNVRSTDPDITKYLIQAYREVLSGTATIGKARRHLPRPGVAKRAWLDVAFAGPVVDYPWDNMRYPMACAGFDPNYLWEEGEEHIVP